MIDELRTKKGLIISIMIFSLFEMIFVTSGAVGPKPNEEKIPSQIIRFLEEDSDSDSDETPIDLDLRFTEEESTLRETEGGTIKITVVNTLTEEVQLFSTAIWSKIQSNIFIRIAGEIISFKASEVPKLKKEHAGKTVEILFKSGPKDLSYIFEENTYIKTLDLTLIKATEITTMEGMCKGAKYMEEINLTGLKTNNLVSMKEMCSGCTSLKTVKITGFVSTNVTTMEGTFKNCSSLESLDLSSLKTPKVTSCKEMFSGCTKLKSINLSGFELGDSVNIDGMFDKCDSLKEVTINKNKNKKVAEVLKAKGVTIKDVVPDSKEEETPTADEQVPIHFPSKSSGGLSAGAIAAIVAVCVVVVVIVVVIIVVVQAKVSSSAGAMAVATTSTVMSGAP